MQERHVHLFRNGRNQALRIPRDMELPGDEAIIRRAGSCLIIEPIEKQNSLSLLLASWSNSTEEFPDIPRLPADDIEL